MKFRDIVLELKNAGIEDAVFEASVLTEKLFGIDYAHILSDREKDFSSPELSLVLKKRKDRYPLQYIVGSWGFCGYEFEVNEGTLIPRSDTETLIPVALDGIAQNGVFVDIGTGSGCIALTLLAERKDLSAVCLDVSEPALAVCRRNAEKLGVASRCRFVCGDMREMSTVKSVGRVDAVISNPPYIPSEDIASLAPELAFEPRSALDGGVDGLDFYRYIIRDWSCLLNDGGFFLFENGVGQSQAIASFAHKLGFISEVIPDIEGRDRAVKIMK